VHVKRGREETGILLWQEQVHSPSIEKTKHPFEFLHDVLEARAGMMAYFPIIFVTVCLLCGASWQIFLSKNDPARYQCYALTFWFGSRAINHLPADQCSFLLPLPGPQLPFHMLPIEYPPLTLAVFSLPLLAPVPYYQLAFALCMSLICVLIYWLLLRYGPRGAALIFALYALVGGMATATERFDLVPAALTLLAILAAERKNWTWAYVALAIGTLIKIYPILFLPAFFIAEQQSQGRMHIPSKLLTPRVAILHLWYTLRSLPQWRWKNTVIFSGIVVGITGMFAVLNFEKAVISQISYFIHRPIQVEATSSTFLWIAHSFGVPLHIENTFGSLNIVSPLDDPISRACTLLLLVGCLFILWRQWCGKFDITQTSIALLFVFIATGKVFSPQYIIWLMPLLAYAGAFDTFWLLIWVPLSCLTSFIQIFFYTRLIDPQLIPYLSGFSEAITLRNTLFVLVTLAYLFNWFQARQRRPLQPSMLAKETRPL
jgi:hypothetical protein